MLQILPTKRRAVCHSNKLCSERVDRKSECLCRQTHGAVLLRWLVTAAGQGGVMGDRQVA